MATRKRKTTRKPESKETARPQLEFTATKICEQPVVPVREFTPEVLSERASFAIQTGSGPTARSCTTAS